MLGYLGRLRMHELEREQAGAWNRRYPMCNFDGQNIFWCEDHVGKPMWVLPPGRQKRRCACVRQPLIEPIPAPMFESFTTCWQEGGAEKCSLRIDLSKSSARATLPKEL